MSDAGSRSGKAIQPLGEARSERAAGDSTPLVMEEGARDSVDRSRAELAGELKGLRSRLQILRAERTAIAGKRYALEVMLEAVREKLEALQEAAAGDDLTAIRHALQDLALAAEGRGSGGGLEAERLAQLEEMQRLEAKVVELKEKNMGYRSERDALREQMSGAGRKIDEAEARAEAAEARLAELEAGPQVSEAARAALDHARQEAALLERASRGLVGRLEGLRGALDGVVSEFEERG